MRPQVETYKGPSKLAWRFIAALATVVAWVASASAQTVVVGTGNPDIDVPAVQAAVAQGGEVILQGHFSFDRLPTVPTPFDDQRYPPRAMVLVSKAVAISGTQDGEMTTIERGTIPFYVEAPGAPVTIRGLRFVRPKATAILVYAVSGLVVASCKIEGVDTWPIFGSDGIEINTSGLGFPRPDMPGHPENISGTLLVVNNDIDVAGGTAQDLVLGIILWGVGEPGAEVAAHVSGNTIRNVTERAIYIRRVVGRAYVEGNLIATGTIRARVPAAGIFVADLGSYLIAHNSVHSQWDSDEAWGIRASGDYVEWPLVGAAVVDNDVNMDAPEGTIFGDRSAGVAIRGNAQGNVALNNRIRGRARAALAVELQGVVGPAANNEFVLNRFDDFEPLLADVFVGDGVMNTLIVGPGSIEDHGVGTVIVPVP